MTAFEILDRYIESRIADLLKQCEKREREALIEFVRSCDLHTYFLHFSAPETLESEWQLRCAFIKLGLSPILKAFLPTLEQYGDGIPWSPSSENNAAWADNILFEMGKLVNLRRLAYCETDGLVSCNVISKEHLFITVLGENSEVLDRTDQTWLIQTELEKNREITNALNTASLGWARNRIDKYVDTDLDWFIRYDSDIDLLNLYWDIARISFIESPESESLPDDAKIGPRSFGEWKNLAIMATGRTTLHLSFATRLSSLRKHLDLRNLLTIFVRQEDLQSVWSQQTEITDKTAIEEISDVFMLTPERADEYYSDHDHALPFHIRFGKHFALLPQYGAIQNPCTFLITELKRKYKKDWDRAVASREAIFRDDLYNLLPQPRYVSGVDNFIVRATNGKPITDIDAIIFDSQTNRVYLFQLKWFDVFGLSLKQRRSKLKNLLHANKWVDDVWSWANNQDPASLTQLFIPKTSRRSTRPVTFKLFVLTRYTARFSEEVKLDHRASWISWPTFARSIIENEDKKSPLEDTWMLSVNPNNKDTHKVLIKENIFPELRVDVSYKG